MIKKFLLGEIRQLCFSVKSTKKEKIVILSADYAIYKDGQILKTGQCDIENEQISLIYDCDEEGQFLLEITYSIAPERRKLRCKIDVSRN